VTATAPAELPTAEERDDRLTTEASKLRSRTGIPVDKWFQIVGTVLPLVGVLAIVGAWYGVSHTAREWRQTPYLVSGGLLGLGFIFLGGFTYFAYWLTKLVEQGHRQTVALERIEAALTGRSRDGAAGADALVTSAGVAHRAECPLLAGRDDVRPFRPGAGVVPCPVCEPELPPEAEPAPRARSRRTRTG
jgi:hypothetical protein